MKFKNWLGVIVIPFLFLSWNKKETKQWIISGNAQGTTYRIQYYASDSVVKKKDIDALLNALDSSVSIYKPYSIISKFNNSENGCKIDQHFKLLVKKSIIVNRQTNGLSDITIKPLVDAWGFGVVKPVDSISDNKIANILSYVGSDKIHLKGNYLTKKNPNTEVDVNGIGQGYAVDLMAKLIEKHGIKNYLVELGGELRKKGCKPDGKPFRVGIASINSNEEMQQIIDINDGAITTSGNYVRYRIEKNKKISHIINPLNGYPVNNEIISVTVWAKNALTADAYDNGFMLMGVARTLHFLKRKKNLSAYIIYKKPDGTVADTASTYFWKHVKVIK